MLGGACDKSLCAGIRRTGGTVGTVAAPKSESLCYEDGKAIDASGIGYRDCAHYSLLHHAPPSVPMPTS